MPVCLALLYILFVLVVMDVEAMMSSVDTFGCVGREAVNQLSTSVNIIHSHTIWLSIEVIVLSLSLFTNFVFE